MTKRPQRPVFDPITPDTLTDAELAHHRALAARYQAARVISLREQGPRLPDRAQVAREAFPVTTWARAARDRRVAQQRAQRLAAISIGIMAYALRDRSLSYRGIDPTRPAA